MSKMIKHLQTNDQRMAKHMSSKCRTNYRVANKWKHTYDKMNPSPYEDLKSPTCGFLRLPLVAFPQEQ